MKNFILILLLFLISCNTNKNNNETVKNEKNLQILKTQPVIEFKVDNNTFPQSWKDPQINAKGISLDSAEIDRSLKIIQQAIKKYPDDVIEKNLKKIYILKSIEFYGQKFGGTNSNDAVYIANKGISEGYSDIFIEMTFHHEFSSILLRNYRSMFPEKEWKSNNSFEYGKGGIDAIKKNLVNLNLDTNLMNSGFLCEYAISDVENDFNTFAENIFCPTDEFRKSINKYQKINSKLNIIIKFYSQISNSFSRSYFDSIPLN